MSTWKHLRVPFQMTLAPIFLWGALLSGATVSGSLALGFAVFHFLLYTGITAFNSFYDRDEGPIGGLENPPPATPSLLPLSLALKTTGFVASLACGASFAMIYVVFVALSVLYSHPRFRWKANPLLSTLVVCGGQGMLGYLAGWAAARGRIGELGIDGWMGMASAGLTTLGMYPLTQVYQIEDDARRGDRTLGVILGADRSMRFAQAAFLAAAVAGTSLCARRFGTIDASAIGAAYAGILVVVDKLRARWAHAGSRPSFRAVMYLLYGSSAAFTGFIFAEWALRRSE